MRYISIILAVVVLAGLAILLLDTSYGHGKPVINVTDQYDRLPCRPADKIPERNLGPSIEIPLPEEFSNVKFTAQAYNPTWIDARHLPRRLDELNLKDNPEDVALALMYRAELRRPMSWVKKCYDKQSVEFLAKFRDQEVARVQEAPLTEVEKRFVPIRYWVKATGRTEDGERYCILYYDRIAGKYENQGGPGGYTIIGAFAFRDTEKGWRRTFEFNKTELGHYLMKDFPRDELMKHFDIQKQ